MTAGVVATGYQRCVWWCLRELGMTGRKGGVLGCSVVRQFTRASGSVAGLARRILDRDVWKYTFAVSIQKYGVI